VNIDPVLVVTATQQPRNTTYLYVELEIHCLVQKTVHVEYVVKHPSGSSVALQRRIMPFFFSVFDLLSFGFVKKKYAWTSHFGSRLP
jgi:hypothetical protein